MDSDSDSSSSDHMQVAAAPAPTPNANRKAPATCAPGAPKPVARAASRTKLVSYVCEEQPTFGDTDDELGIAKEDRMPMQPAKKAKIAKKEKKEPVARRLFVSSEGVLLTKVDELVLNDYNVAIVPMNYSISHRTQLPNGAHYMDCHAYRQDSPAENFDVVETGNAWEPGAAELAGIAVTAYEIAEFLVESERNSVIVVSKRGNAPKLLVGCASQVVRKLVPRGEAASIIGHQAPHLTGELKKVYEAFPKWTRVTAPHEIVSFA